MPNKELFILLDFCKDMTYHESKRSINFIPQLGTSIIIDYILIYDYVVIDIYFQNGRDKSHTYYSMVLNLVSNDPISPILNIISSKKEIKNNNLIVCKTSRLTNPTDYEYDTLLILNIKYVTPIKLNTLFSKRRETFDNNNFNTVCQNEQRANLDIKFLSKFSSKFIEFIDNMPENKLIYLPTLTVTDLYYITKCLKNNTEISDKVNIVNIMNILYFARKYYFQILIDTCEKRILKYVMHNKGKFPRVILDNYLMFLHNNNYNDSIELIYNIMLINNKNNSKYYKKSINLLSWIKTLKHYG